MRIGILECDVVRDVFREAGFPGYPAMFEKHLSAVDADLEFRSYNCVHDEFPATTGECDAYITTGSRHSVFDGYDWIDRLEDFALDLLEAGRPYVGICFGHQLLAQAMGGQVIRADAGWGVGVSRNVITTPLWWMRDRVQERINLLVSHQDQVVEMPKDMELLGGSEFCPIYFCQVGNNALTIQGHPEFSRDYSRAIMDYRRDVIPAPDVEAGIESLQLPVHEKIVFEWIVNFMKGDSSHQT